MKATTLTVESSGGAARAVVLWVTAWAALAIALSAGVARGDELSDIPAAFVDVGVGAGPMGMGGAVVAGSEGASSIFWNPAGLARGGRPKEVMLTYCDQMGLVPYSAAAGLFRLGDYTFGAGIIYSGDDVLSETTGLLSAAREIVPSPWVADATIDAGVTLRTRWASFGDNASTEGQVTGSAMGVGLDIGAVVPVTPSVTIGVYSRDIVSSLNWDSSESGSYGENVPAALIMGAEMTARDNLTLEIDLDKSLRQDVSDVVAAGAELVLFDVAAVRAGYRTALPERELEEFSVGAGAGVMAGTTEITLDIAYLFGPLDGTLRLTLNIAL
jgi:hypothetical protein